MKTKIYLRLTLLVTIGMFLLAGCTSKGDDFDYGKEVILVTGTDSNPLIKFVVEDTPASYTVTASATGKVSEDVVVKFAQDNSLIEAYNAKNKTNFFAIPESAIQIDGTQGIIKAGTASSTGITVRVVSTEDFKDGRTYVIPITIESVSGGNMDVLPASKTIFLRVSRIINFNSLDMTNTYFYGNYYAETPVDLPMYTYEIKCLVNQWHPGNEPISRLSNFAPIDESVTNLLRFGENGQDVNSLQWVSPGGGLISSTRFNTGQWYTISLTFDGSNYIMYVDGIKDAELAGTKGTTFQRLELGMSWYDSGNPGTSYPYRQRFLGRIAEIRLWNRPLSTSELQIGLCGVDPESEGLVAYWKLNEGEGHIFHDATGNGFDMDWSKAWQNEIQYNKSGYVKWLFDDKNKCSQ
ncbi:BT_3987 domain-containing protein [Gaoshiqia sp. Z1-71]|uniref:BT_3987 domain-containing protein n=1 Tax=Gaoshiqia hydrogeniformans TaxID=3290090 RepID=UPI003BF7A3C6